jgi:hypothetical protein
MSYAVAYSFAWAFLRQFGAVPEEIGYSQPALIIREVALGSVLIFLGIIYALIISVVLVCAITFAVVLLSQTERLLEALLSKPFHWLSSHLPVSKLISRRIQREVNRARSGVRSMAILEKGPKGRIRRRTALFVLTSAVVLSTLGQIQSVDPPSHRNWAHMVDSWLFGIMLTSLVVYLLVDMSRLLAAGLVYFSIFAFTLTVATGYGYDSATNVKAGHPTFIQLNAFGLQADHVRTSRSDGKELKSMPPELILLGHDDGIFLLAGPQALYRIREEGLVLEQIYEKK